MKKHKKSATTPKPKPRKKSIPPTINAAWFKSRLKDQGLSQRQMAKILQINHTSFTQILKGARKLKLDEASTVAERLGVGLDQVLLNLGIPVPETETEKTIRIDSWLDSGLNQVAGSPSGPKVARMPPYPRGVRCLRAQTAMGKYAAMDGWLLYYVPQTFNGFDPELIGKPCLVKIKGDKGNVGPAGNGPTGYRFRTPIKGYSPGRYTLTHFGQEILEENTEIESAFPVVLMSVGSV